MNKEFNLIEAIRIIQKWKKPIFILSIASVIASSLWSLFVMDEYFYSWSTFYPVNQTKNDYNVIFGKDGEQINYFGSGEDVNRVLTIANSVPVIESIIDSYHLAEHYKINKEGKHWRTKVRKEFESNYKAIKTEREAMEVSLYDTDPKLASEIVNTIIDKVDALNREHYRMVRQKTYSLILDEIIKWQKEINVYSDTLALLAEKYKIKMSSGADGTVIITGTNFRIEQLYKEILSKQNNSTRELNSLTTIKGQMEVSLKNSDSSLYILEKAFPADKKLKPVRWLVVTITLFITLFVSVIGVLCIEQIHDIKQQL